MKKQFSSKSKYWLWICIAGFSSVTILYITTQSFSIAHSNDEVVEMELSPDETNNSLNEKEENHSAIESNDEVVATEISQEENNDSPLHEKEKSNFYITINEYDAIVNLFKSETVTTHDVSSMILAEPIYNFEGRVYEYEGENEGSNVVFRFAYDGTLLHISENNLFKKSTYSTSLDQLYDETIKINNDIWDNYKIETLNQLFTGELSKEEVIRETEIHIINLEAHSDKIEKFKEENNDDVENLAMTGLQEATIFRSFAFQVMRVALEESSDLSEAEESAKLTLEMSDQILLEATKKLGRN
ncbi:hypothetical protein FLK61_28655 [Paenalkalicoccus suaedae]|uniref:Uncharacterized protein n=1 Tax=Paenalkalicoccus suaedae TaxID=2592382 RepID=A0A859FD23_9BACI|nr:hypothetical protein [Paenalkalicoccus suaedae]QKS70711.1 hypothetical protein FLK61_28655 [Paenalkalicoccus suaedae]